MYTDPNLTDRDRHLIAQAWRIPSQCWDDVNALIAQADTPQAVKTLERIRSYLYHKDEHLSGML